MLENIRDKFDKLLTDHPDLQKPLEAGFLLAMAGAVSIRVIDGHADWDVAGHAVKLRPSTEGPMVWLCDCGGYKFKKMSDAYRENFDGYQGRICKHVSASSISDGNMLVPISDEFDFLVRLVSVQYLPPKPKDQFVIPGTTTRIVHRSNGTIALKKGHRVSKSLGEYVHGENKWKLYGEDRHIVIDGGELIDNSLSSARFRYNAWVKSLEDGNDE